MTDSDPRDITERLRDFTDRWESGPPASLVTEAIDTIAHLRGERDAEHARAEALHSDSATLRLIDQRSGKIIHGERARADRAEAREKALLGLAEVLRNLAHDEHVERTGLGYADCPESSCAIYRSSVSSSPASKEPPCERCGEERLSVRHQSITFALARKVRGHMYVAGRASASEGGEI